MNDKTPIMDIDARALDVGVRVRVGEVWRRVLSVRRYDGGIEVLHGNPAHPGGLDYFSVPTGGRVVVPVFG